MSDLQHYMEATARMRERAEAAERERDEWKERAQRALAKLEEIVRVDEAGPVTNAQLIARLQELPPDLPVRTGSREEDGPVVAAVLESDSLPAEVWGPHIRLEW